MIETEKQQQRIRRAFGPDAEITESSGVVEIRSAGALLGSGTSFAPAMAAIFGAASFAEDVDCSRPQPETKANVKTNMAKWNAETCDASEYSE